VTPFKSFPRIDDSTAFTTAGNNIALNGLFREEFDRDEYTEFCEFYGVVYIERE
jgi:hypothetical protein